MNDDLDPMTVYTSYSYEQMRGFLRYQLRSLRRTSLPLCALMVPMSVYSGYLMISSDDADLSRLLTVNFLVFILPLLMLGMSFGLFYTRKQHTKAIRLIPNGQTTRFFSYSFESQSDNYLQTSQSAMRYEALVKVVEVKDMFYLYTAPNAAILIDKQGFSSGTPEELRRVLGSFLPPGKCRFYKKAG